VRTGRWLGVTLAALALGAAGVGAALETGIWRPFARPETADATVVVPLPAITINLNGDDGFQYLQLQVALVTRGPMSTDALRQAVADRQPALMDCLTKTIEGRRFTIMRTTEGMQALDEALRSQLSAVLVPVQVERVYFEEFVAE